MKYEEARAYIYEALKKGSILGLDNITNLMDKLDNPQDKLNIIHVAGTNGKGSVSEYVSEILINSGYRVGKYTSPSVFEYLEIFKINNINISEGDYAQCMTEIAEAVELMKQENQSPPTAFEIETALAFLYFYKSKCDIVIIETGLGGRFDATNVIRKPLCSVITSISMDHMQFLGNTLAEIAYNKAGIIKDECPVVSAIQENEAAEVIADEADKHHSELIICNEGSSIRYSIEGTSYNYETVSNEYFKDVSTRMLGTFQVMNMSAAIETILCVKRQMAFDISYENIYYGINNASWHGRFEKIASSPDIYFDGGHNPGAAKKIKESVDLYFTNRRLIYIIGVLADKDYDKVLSLTAPEAEYIYTVTPDNLRALDGRLLLENVKKYNVNADYCPNFEQAVAKAEQKAGIDGVILVYGSLSYLLDIRKIIDSGICNK